ncbi:MAG: putative signal transducing protein [Nitrospiria bacterium]
MSLHVFPSRMEAEMAGEILKQADIPFLIQSEDIGIFGPGAVPAPAGARIMVREEDLIDAKAFLARFI